MRRLSNTAEWALIISRMIVEYREIGVRRVRKILLGRSQVESEPGKTTARSA